MIDLMPIKINIFLYRIYTILFNILIYTLFKISQPFNIYRIKTKKRINIAFIVMNLSMWKYDKLFILLSENKRFNPLLIIAPRLNQMSEGVLFDIHQLENYCKRKAFRYRIGYNEKKEILFNLKSFKPDIIFYTQPQINKLSLNRKFWFSNFRCSLIAHVPYDYKITALGVDYNLLMHNIAWKLFYPNQEHKNDAYLISYNKGKNVIVTGYPMADEFINQEPTSNPWGEYRFNKRIIWAPHHSITSIDILDFSTFLEISEFMKSVVYEYNDCQFAFKPHPVLKYKLYEHKEWGKEKTDMYYNFWSSTTNTILSEDYYVDLFLSSDALMHDCSSFSVEYLFTKKPVLFLNNNISNLSEFGKQVLNLHYKRSNNEDIKNFIMNVVINNNDVLLDDRLRFFNSHLIPPNSKSASQNIIDNIAKSLHG